MAETFHISFPSGCTRRQLDCERIRTYFESNGLKECPRPYDSDYLVISTCGLTQEKEDRCIEDLRLVKKNRYRGRVVLYGCLPAMNPKRIRSVYRGDITVTEDIENFDRIFPRFGISMRSIPDGNTIPDFIPGKDRQKEFDRYFSIRISEGCLGQCSYCNIKKAIGSLKSKPVDVVLKELDIAIQKGEFGINIASSDSGSYGMDIGTTFPELINRILERDERVIIRFIQDFSPKWLVRYEEAFYDFARGNRIKMLLTPFQSGSPKILKAMKRAHEIGRYKDIICRIKQINPSFLIQTQIIVGFPGETDEDFEMTMDVLRSCPFDIIDVFRYYETNLTEARRLKPKVPESVICERMTKTKVFKNSSIYL